MTSPRSRRRGFTLIELLAVVLIIAILASVAMTKFSESKRRAYLTAMRSDLRGVATLAESHFAADNSYEGIVAPQGSDGVTLTFVGNATGWAATATHANVPGVECTMAAGSSLDANVPNAPICP